MADKGDADLKIVISTEADLAAVKAVKTELKSVTDVTKQHGAAVHEASGHVKLFGLNHRQLHMAMHGVGRVIPGLNIALRLLGGGVMATMGAFMLFGTAVEKVKERLKEIEEASKKFLEEAAKPVTHAMKANEEAVIEDAKAMAHLDAELIKITGHQKTLAEKTKEAEESLRDEAKAAKEIAGAQAADEMAQLEELHKRKILSEDEFLREISNLKAKHRADEIKRQAEEERAALERLKAELKQQQDARAEFVRKDEEAYEAAEKAKKKVTRQGTLEEVKKRHDDAMEQRDKTLATQQAIENGNVLGLPMEDQAKIWSMSAVGLADQAWSEVRAKYESKLGGEEATVTRTALDVGMWQRQGPKNIRAADFAEQGAKEARATRMANEQSIATLPLEIAKKEREIGAAAHGRAGATTVEAGQRERQAQERDFATWSGGGAVASGEKKRRLDAIWEAQRSGKITPEVADRLRQQVGAVPDAPSRNQVRSFLRMKYDRMPFVNQAAREAAFRTEAAMLPVSPNYGQVYRLTDQQLRAAGVAGFSEGGYTGDGPPGQVKGSVHANELVLPLANAAATESLMLKSLSGDYGTAAASSMQRFVRNADLAETAGAFGHEASYSAYHGAAMKSIAASQKALKVAQWTGKLGGIAGKFGGPLAVFGLGLEGLGLASNFRGRTGSVMSDVGRNPLKGLWSGLTSPLTTIASVDRTEYDLAREIGGMFGRPTAAQQRAAARARGPRGGIGTSDDGMAWQGAPAPAAWQGAPAPAAWQGAPATPAWQGPVIPPHASGKSKSARYWQMEWESAQAHKADAGSRVARMMPGLFSATQALAGFRGPGTNAPMSEAADFADTMARIHRRNAAYYAGHPASHPSKAHTAAPSYAGHPASHPSEAHTAAPSYAGHPASHPSEAHTAAPSYAVRPAAAHVGANVGASMALAAAALQSASAIIMQVGEQLGHLVDQNRNTGRTG